MAIALYFAAFLAVETLDCLIPTQLADDPSSGAGTATRHGELMDNPKHDPEKWRPVFSEKIMLKQRDEVMMRLGLIASSTGDKMTAATQDRKDRNFVMIGALARRFFGSANRPSGQGLSDRVDAITRWKPELAALSDEALKARTDEFRKELAEGKTLDDILVPAFATVREGAKRTLGQRHFDVQLIGGMVLQ